MALKRTFKISFESKRSARSVFIISNVITRVGERNREWDQDIVKTYKGIQIVLWLRFYSPTALFFSLSHSLAHSLSSSLFHCLFLSLPRRDNFAFIFSRQKERGSRIGASLRPQTFQKSPSLCKVTGNNFLRCVFLREKLVIGQGENLIGVLNDRWGKVWPFEHKHQTKLEIEGMMISTRIR